MKSKFIKACSILMIFQNILIGCNHDEYQSDQQIWEISPADDNAFIQNEVNGIEFKFCLLNEEGKPSTVFNEGDNFSFYFSVTNNRNEELYFDPRFPYFVDNFFRVYNSDDLDLGRPFNYDSMYLTTIGIAAFPFPENYIHEYQVTWLDDNEASWIWYGDVNKSAPQKPLPKGNYYTYFVYRFRFAVPYEPDIYIDTQFKIDFKIQ